MKSDKRFENKTTFWAFVAILIFLIGASVWNKCSAQMTIPLMQGTVDHGDVWEVDESGAAVSDKGIFDLTQSYFKASTTELRIEFKRRKHERMNLLKYPIDSIDISGWCNDGFRSVTLWPYNDPRHEPSALKIEIYTNEITYNMFIYNAEETFFFTGKVL